MEATARKGGVAWCQSLRIPDLPPNMLCITQGSNWWVCSGEDERCSEKKESGGSSPALRQVTLHHGGPQPRFWVLQLIRAPFSTRTTHSVNMAQSDEEDDYMNMVFEDAPKGPKYETSLQRAARRRTEVRLFGSAMMRIVENSIGRS